MYKHFASVFLSFQVGHRIFASSCNHLLLDHPARRRPVCCVVHPWTWRHASASLSPSPFLSTRRPSWLLHLIWHALWAWEMCETVHCPSVGFGFPVKPTQSTSVCPVEILGNYCVAICSVTRFCFTIHHGPKPTPPDRQYWTGTESPVSLCWKVLDRTDLLFAGPCVL